MKSLRPLLVVCLAAPSPLAASAWTPPERIGAAGASPRVAAQDDGKAMAVWCTHWTRPRHESGLVWSRLYEPGLGWRQAEVISNHGPNGEAGAPSVAVHPDGGWVALWRVRYENGATALWASLRRREEAWGPAERVSEQAWRLDGAYAMRVDGLGDVLVLWRGVDGRQKGALLSTRRVRGRWQASEVVAEDFVRDDSDTLTFGIGGDGRALAAWSTPYWSSGIGLWRLVITAFDPVFGWSRPKWVSDELADFMLPYDIAFDRRGEALLVWTTGWGYGDGLWVRRLLPGGVWDGRARFIGAGSAASATYDDDGNAFVVWETDGAGSGIEGARFDRRTASWEPARVLEVTRNGEEGLRPKVRAGGGRVVAAWHHDGNRVLSSATYDPWSGWTRLPDVRAARPSAEPVPSSIPHDLAVDSEGNAFLVWMDDPEIWTSRLPFER